MKNNVISVAYHIRHQPMVLLLAVALISACARTQPAAYYHLSAIDSDRPPIAGSPSGEAIIGIGPLLLPEYLDRPQIVSRTGSNLMHLAEGHRWAEPLAVSIPRVMRENLAAALATERIHCYPWRGNVDYQLVIEILRFDGEGNFEAHLEAVWSIQDRKGKILLPQRRSEYQVTASPADSEGLVLALSRTLGLLCREIAQQFPLPEPQDRQTR